MEKEKNFSFKKQLSFDGVAFIVAIVGLAVWVGSLKQSVAEHERRIDYLEATERQLSDTSARLTVLVERNQHP